MRVICLVDCDSFYVSCERRDNPQYIGKPVCVLTGAGTRGIIVSRSKEAKEAGILMGKPLFMAQKTNPSAIYLPARIERYLEISKEVMRCLKTFSPTVEVVSVDEAYMDLTGLNEIYHQTYVELIRAIRRQIAEKIGIPVSIGLATSKTLAKLASDKAKQTGGIFCISPKRVQETIGCLEIEAVCGVGKQTARRLKQNGIFTVADFLARPDSWVRQSLGKNGLLLKHELAGESVSAVCSEETPPKSIYHTGVIGDFSNNINLLRNELHYHIHQACRKLREKGGFCGVIGVMLRQKNFQTDTEKQKLSTFTQSEQEIGKVAEKVLEKLFREHILYRSIGIELENLTYPDEQEADLFCATTLLPDKLGHTVDDLEQKFGKNIVQIGWFGRQGKVLKQK